MAERHPILKNLFGEEMFPCRNVSWTNDQGEKFFGTVLDDDDFVEYMDNGFIPVQDAIKYVLHLVKPEDIAIVPLGKFVAGDRSSFSSPLYDDEFHRYISDEANKAHALSCSLDGLKVGKLFSMPVADGKVWYVVTKVNKKTVKIEWRNFGYDMYFDRVFGIGGSFNKDLIEKLVNSEDALQRIFGHRLIGQD